MRIWSLSHNLNVPFNLQFKVLLEACKFLPVLELLFNTGNNCIISQFQPQRETEHAAPLAIASAQSNLLFQSIKLIALEHLMPDSNRTLNPHLTTYFTMSSLAEGNDFPKLNQPSRPGPAGL